MLFSAFHENVNCQLCQMSCSNAHTFNFTYTYAPSRTATLRYHVLALTASCTLSNPATG